MSPERKKEIYEKLAPILGSISMQLSGRKRFYPGDFFHLALKKRYWIPHETEVRAASLLLELGRK